MSERTKAGGWLEHGMKGNISVGPSVRSTGDVNFNGYLRHVDRNVIIDADVN